jgi:hypothetical protein
MAPGLVRANKFLAGKARFEQRKLSAIPSCHHLHLQRKQFYAQSDMDCDELKLYLR